MVSLRPRLQCTSEAMCLPFSCSLRGVICFLELSAALRRTTITCILWACSINLLGIPAAAGLLLLLPGRPLVIPPPVAAVLMAISSVLVIHTASTLRYPTQILFLGKPPHTLSPYSSAGPAGNSIRRILGRRITVCCGVAHYQALSSNSLPIGTSGTDVHG